MNMNMNKMLKQAQQLQKKMAQQQEELSKKTYEASSGGGMVSAVVNGKNELIALKIEEDVVDKDDVVMLQDLVIAAVNEASKRAQEDMQNAMGSMMGGMKIPGLF